MSNFHNPGLAGNPHFRDVTAITDQADQLVSATLALAYEQRTANLIALMGWFAQQGAVSKGLAAEVDERLGTS